MLGLQNYVFKSGQAGSAGTASRHIVFVNRFFYPDESATSQILSDLAFHMAREGYRVSVITSRLDYGRDARDFVSREQVGGVDIHRIWTTQYHREHLLGRAIDFISFYASAIIKLVSLSDRASLVVLKTDPPMLATAVGPFLGLKRVRYCNWLQDLFPEVAEAAGFSIAGGFLGSVLRRLRNRTLRHAQMNVVIGERMRERLLESGVPHGQIAYIPNWSVGESITPLAAEANPLRKEWNLEGDFVVGYSGNFGRVHEFGTLLEAARLLLPVKSIKFVLIGHGVQQAEVQQFVDENSLSNVQFRPYQPRTMLRESLGVADVHIVSLLPAMEGYIVPSKVYGVAAAGRPVVFIGDSDGEVARLLESEQFGHSVGIDEHELLARQIRSYADNPDMCAEYGRQARRVFDTSFCDNVVLQQWGDLLEQQFLSRSGAGVLD